MTPRWGNTVIFRSSQELSCLRLGPLKGVVTAQKALDLPRALLPKLQRYKDTVRCVARQRSQDTVKNNRRKP